MRRLSACLCAALALRPVSAFAQTHAYTVEYRPLDRCAPPDCRIDGLMISGNVLAGAAAGYAAFGSDKTELFAKRAIKLGEGERLAFDLPASDDPSAFEASLASADPNGGSFQAVLQVDRGEQVIFRRAFAGKSEGFALAKTSAGFGREERYFARIRENLPPRGGRVVTVSLANEGKGSMVVASPLVWRRVSGRAARHAVLVVFDAVPYPLLLQLFADRGEVGARWLGEWVSERGLLFPHAMSPGQLTGSFVRRFFKGDFYRLDGEPSLLGQGFFETPPRSAQGPVSRLSETGFFTVAVGSNLYLTPMLGRIGFDGNYNLESTLDLPADPPILARRFDAEVAAHSEDDALFVVWFGSTHMPWREGRAFAPPLRDFEIPRADLDSDVLGPIWKNLLQAADSFREVKTSAATRAPSADRIWIALADHGHTFTLESRDRPWRLTGEAVDRGHMHCCLSTQQEVRTPMLVLAENGPAERGIVDRPISTVAAWRAIERRFGVDLGLPKTSAFALVGEKAFDDGVVVSVGNSGTLAARSGDLCYRSYEPSRKIAPAWSVSREVALLLAGSPARAGDIVSEELYDLRSDPGERTNLASDRFADLLAMREKVTHWLAEYVDTPDHPRHRYVLRFAKPVGLDIAAPRNFTISVDGGARTPAGPNGAVRGSRFEIDDGEAPLGVADLSGESFVVRCASSGLPVATIDPAHPRIDLALARNNCPTDDRVPAATPRSGEALFEAALVSSRTVKAGPGGRLPALTNALRRWGYVRDK
jgi:hypothetical protein